jgi:glycosyltransferase involved in cell wall biosynthesis
LPVIWNVQMSTFSRVTVSRRTKNVIRLCARASRRVPQVIVSCSHVAAAVHQRIGYADKFHVIPNGIDTEIFRPDSEARRAVREELGLTDGVPVVGMLARFHPQKDHGNFFAAAADLHRTHPDVRFALCGLGTDRTNEEFMALARQAGVERQVIAVGLRRDPARVLNGFDLHALSSGFGEAFPNALGEAMATGVPCVVTDVGDCPYVVGDTGVVVPPHDPAALANGWRALLDLTPEARAELSRRARQRIENEFSLASAVGQYESLYESVAGANGHHR